MGIFLIILAFGLTVADKLDRSYLPPPGSKYAGGSPGSIDLPLEYPEITSTSDQELNKNKGFRITPTVSVINNSQFKFGKPSEIQVTENVEMSNGIISDVINQLPTNTNENIENGIVTNKPSYPKSQTKEIGYENLNNIPELNFQDQKVISDFKNTVNQLGYTPVIRTGQNTNESSLQDKILYRESPFKKPDSSFGEVEETAYRPNNFGIKAPSDNSMYKDSTIYGTQAMYRPDTIYSEFNTDSSAPNSPPKFIRPESNSPYTYSNQNYENSLNMYPNDVRSQTSPIFPNLSPISLNKPSATNQRDDALLTKASQSINQGDAILYYKRPERPQAEGDRNAYILKYENIVTPEGFSYSYDTSNGIHADESGTAIDGVKAKGSYSYTDDDGQVYTIKYTADENGFRPIGDHLPTPPPIPIEIQAALNQIARDIETGNLDDGSYDEKKYGYEKYQGKLDHSKPRLQYSTVISENIQESIDSKKKPIETIGKNQKQSVNNQIDNILTTERYPSTRPTNLISDTNDNRASGTIPYSKNRQYPENINIRMKGRPIQKVIINQDNTGYPDTPFKVTRPEADIVNPEFISQPQDFKTFNSNVDETNEFNPTDEILNKNDSEKKTSTNFNQYLPEFHQNKFSYQIEPKNSSANIKITTIGQKNNPLNGDVVNVYTVQNTNQREDTTPNNVKVTISSDSKAGYPMAVTEQNFVGSVNDNLKLNEYNGYQYTPPNKNSTPNLNQLSANENEYIPTSKTNYDESNNKKLNSGFDLPSTIHNSITPTDKYSNTYTSPYGDEGSTPRYEVTPKYYSEPTKPINYDTEDITKTISPIELGQTKISYNQEYILNKDKIGSGVIPQASIRPSQKFEYTQPQEYTTPILVDKVSHDEKNVNFPTNKENYYDKTLPTRLNKHNTSNKYKSDVFMGYTYDKPSSYNNLPIFEENNSSIFSQADVSSNKDVIYPNNRYNFNNQKERLSLGMDFKEGSGEPNYYIDDNKKVPNYNLVENTKYNDQSIKDTPPSKERTFIKTQYIGENVDSNKPDKLISLITGSSIVYKPKEKYINRFGSEYIRPTESNDAVDQITKNPISKNNGIFDGSRYIGDVRPKVDTKDRVIGEDFSGPKRPQGFDPVTGYSY